MALQNTFYFDVDLKQPTYIQEPRVTQNDEVTFVLRLFDDGVPFNLTDVSTYTLVSQRKDKQSVLTNGTKTGDNEITFTLGSTEVSLPGKVKAAIQLYDVNGRISSIPFTYNVLDDLSTGYIPSADDQTLIELVLGEGPAILLAAENATTEATEAADRAQTMADLAKAEAQEANSAGIYARDNGLLAQQKAALANASATNADIATSDAVIATQDAQNATNAINMVLPNVQGLVNLASYNASTTYKKNNIVEHNGSSWQAIQDTTGNTPPTLPTKANAYWSLLAQRGIDGTGAVSSVNGVGPDVNGDVEITIPDPDLSGLATKTEVSSQLKNISVDVKSFGAIGDGVADDREAIQNAIDYLISVGGGTLLFPATSDFYNIASASPSDPLSALTFNRGSLSMYVGGNISFVGQGWQSRLLLNTSSNITSLLKINGRTNYFKMNNMYLDANHKADYALKMNDDYHPYLAFAYSTFRRGRLASATISTFVAKIDNCDFADSLQDGVIIKGIEGGPVTSLTLSNCYANNNVRYGYNWASLNTYCSMISCAADNNDIAYYMIGCYGFSMVGCGVETSRKAAYFDSWRKVSISSFYGLSVGSTTSANDYLIEFKSGRDAVLSGIYMNTTRMYKKILGLTGNAEGNENITVLDASILRSDIDFITSLNYTTRPIKLLRGDETNRDITVTLSPEGLFEHLKQLEFMEINHNYTIQISNGTQIDATTYGIIRGLKGSGKLIIQGNSTDNTLVKIHAGSERLTLNDNTCQIVFRNLTLENRTSNAYTTLLKISNSKRVVLDNVLLVAIGNAGSAILTTDQSFIHLINGTRAVGNFQYQGIRYVYNIDKASKLYIEDKDAIPTAGYWGVGNKFNYVTPTSSGFIGAVCTAAGSPGTWKGFGAIQA